MDVDSPQVEKYKGKVINQLNLQKYLIVQTAFIGDVILTLPIVQLIKEKIPHSEVDFLTISRSAEILNNHPDINSIIIYEKNKEDRGIIGFLKILKKLKQKKYQIAVIPHRSLRSALLVYMAGIPKRIGFDRSAGKFLFTDIIKYNNSLHEIERNISLLSKLLEVRELKIFPKLYPDISDINRIESILANNGINKSEKFICVAPGSVWNTKRWTKEGYIELIKKLIKKNYLIFLIGSKSDFMLCDYIKRCVNDSKVINLAGELNLLQSAELIKSSVLLVSNDSAPVHIATAMNTPVVVIFGPTSPVFGFYPYHQKSEVIEFANLKCRPCRIHGSKKCPTGKFECMTGITHELVLDKVEEILNKFDKVG